MIHSPLLTSLIALCIFSLFCLVILGQRCTTPMVTVVCPVTSLHHMASLQSASSDKCRGDWGSLGHFSYFVKYLDFEKQYACVT